MTWIAPAGRALGLRRRRRRGVDVAAAAAAAARAIARHGERGEHEHGELASLQYTQR